MKKLILSAAIASLSVAANAAPTVYGQLDLSLNNYDITGKENTINVGNQASRIGFKGSEDIKEGLSVVYLAELGFKADGESTTSTSTSVLAPPVVTPTAITVKSTSFNDLSFRDRYVGIKSKSLGTLKVGGFDTYLKQAQGKVDLFNDTANEDLDMKAVFVGENRVKNAIGYESPAIIPGLNINMMLQQGEQLVNEGIDGARNSIADGVSISAVYDQMSNETLPFYAAIAVDKKINKSGDAATDIVTAKITDSTASVDTVRLVGSIKPIKPLTINAMFQTAEQTEAVANEKQSGFLLSAAYNIIGNWTAKVQYQTSTLEKDAAVDTDTDQIAVGLDYAYGPKTKVYGYYGSRNVSVGLADTDAKILGIALLQKF